VEAKPEPRERSTRQRRAIKHVFETADRPLSPEEVLAAVQGEGAGGSLATVYRSIRALLDQGALTSVDLPGAGAFYELSGKSHHHHFSCLNCRRVYELDGCLSDESFTLPRGFKAVAHDLTVFGTCRSCR
jgi:Fur family transcriptional regulator, ferric uptake regulator